MNDFNSFSPPDNDKTVKMTAGISGPGKQALNNLPKIWFENVKRLQKGDIMICGGDFIQACAGCCLPISSTTGSMTCEEAGKLITPNYPCCDADKCGMNCICPCAEENPKFPPEKNDQDLIKETIAAMTRGAQVVFVDDFLFIETVYPDNKPNHDFVFLTLLKASQDIQNKTQKQMFWWYVMPTEGSLHIHAKVFTFYFIGDNNKQKPYIISNIGSFNPSFPISLTLEISTVCTGLTTNTLMRGLGTYVYDLVMAVIKNNEIYNNIEPQPLTDIRKILNIDDSLKFQDIIYSDVLFCGKTFCSKNIDNSKYHSDEQRINFKASNVEFKIGGEPKLIFKRFNYGLDLVNNLIADSKKYLKIGIMQNIIDMSYGTNEYGWTIKDTIKTQVDKQLPIYLIQKPYPPKGQANNCENIYKIESPMLWNETNLLGNNPIRMRWYKSGFHWKFYMNESTVLLSTQHPTDMFYSSSAVGTMGYEVTIKSPEIVAYFDNLYNFYWKYTACKAGFDPQSPDDLPCSGGKDNNCCIIPNSIKTKTCFPGETEGIKYSLKENSCVEDPDGEYYDSNCDQNPPTPPTPPTPILHLTISQILQILLFVSFIILIIALILKYARKK